MEIKETEVGLDYLEALRKVILIRKQRRKFYSDSFLDDDIYTLICFVEGKLNRFKISNNFENKEDSIIDAINYLIFILCDLNKK